MFLFLLSAVSLILVTAPLARAQVVSAPYSVSQRLLNPAAAVTRAYQTFALGLEYSNEKTDVLGLQNSSVTEDIAINQALIHDAWLWRTWYLELDVAYQAGVKTQKNTYIDTTNTVGSSQENQNKLNLIPVQFAAATRLKPSLNLGFKLLATMANVNTTDSYHTLNNGSTTVNNQDNKLDARLIVLGVGLTYNLPRNFAVSYAADFNQFEFSRNVTGDTTSTTSGNTTISSNTNIKNKATNLVRRDIAGLGYSAGNPKGTAFRSEISFERISPLEPRDDLKEGHLLRATAEAQWSYFHVGAEYITQQGFMIDSYNLIPYFFKFERFSNLATNNFGFFGGFKSTKGHSFGAFYSTSNEKVREKLSSSDQTIYDMQRKTQAIGLSYSYVF